MAAWEAWAAAAAQAQAADAALVAACHRSLRCQLLAAAAGSVQEANLDSSPAAWGRGQALVAGMAVVQGQALEHAHKPLAPAAWPGLAALFGWDQDMQVVGASLKLVHLPCVAVAGELAGAFAVDGRALAAVAWVSAP